MITFNQTLLRGLLVAFLAVVPAIAGSAERKIPKKVPTPVATKSVDMFDAMKSKDIDVKFVPKDETEARLTIKNNTGEPLSVRLPEAFAGMPVLAQRGGGGIGGIGGGGGQQGGQQQAMGGGMGGGMMGGGGMGGGMMNIAPEKVVQFKVSTVCLEHGKKPPRASVPYEIKPIESFTSSSEVKSLLVAFGRRRLSQRSTQAAAWHLSSGLTWEQLASKRIQEFGDPVSHPWFSEQEIREGMAISQHAVAQAQAEAIAKKSSGETGSLNEPSAAPGKQARD